MKLCLDCRSKEISAIWAEKKEIVSYKIAWKTKNLLENIGTFTLTSTPLSRVRTRWEIGYYVLLRFDRILPFFFLPVLTFLLSIIIIKWTIGRWGIEFYFPHKELISVYCIYWI